MPDVNLSGRVKSRNAIACTCLAGVLVCGAWAAPAAADCTPVYLATFNTPAFASDLAVVGDVAYVADSDGGLQIIDISNPASPAWLGVYSPPGQVWNVTVAGHLAFVGAGAMQIVDVSNPAAPDSLGVYEHDQLLVEGVAVAGNLAYIADYYFGLRIVDVSDPAAPVALGVLDTPGKPNGLCVVGTTAYIADGGLGLQIIDVSNPAAPALLGSIDTQHAYMVSVVDGYAYVADHLKGLRIIDVSDPSAPTIVGSYDTPWFAMGVCVVGHVAYVSDYDGPSSGLLVIDVSDPAAPVLLGEYDTPGHAQAVSVAGGVAFLADGGYGLQIIDVSSCAPCYADCDGSGELDIDDFICFQTAFGTGDDYADCDGSGELDIDDFICFQTAFGVGCP